MLNRRFNSDKECWNCGNVMFEEYMSQKDSSLVIVCESCKYPNEIEDWKFLKDWEKKTGFKVYSHEKESLDSMYEKFLEFQRESVK